MFWYLIGIAVITAIYYYLIKPSEYWAERGVKYLTSSGLIFDDTTWNFMLRRNSTDELISKIYNAYPNDRYFGAYLFSIPILTIRDPDLIKQITVKDFDHFVDHRPFLPADVDPLWSSNLFASRGQKWRDMRSLISPVFTSRKMKQMFGLMNENAEHFVNYFLSKKEDLITVELKDIFTRYTNDIIASIAFGIKCDSLEERDNEFYQRGKSLTDFSKLRKILKMFAIMLIPRISRFLNLGMFPQSVRNYYVNIVKGTIESREKNNIIRPDLIHLLMEARKNGLKYEESNDDKVDDGFAVVEESEIGKNQNPHKLQITDIDITGQALIFFFAGFDSVATLLCFTFYELGLNLEIQQRLQEEIDETFKYCDGKLTYEALLKMKYLDMVICESLRKWPANLPSNDRVCTKPYTILPVSPDEKPVHLKEGDAIWLPTFAIHRDPQYFPDPEKFDPERFNDENKDKIVPYTYIPFGVGPRNCIGSRFALLETKALMFHLLSKFDIVPIEKTQIPLKLSKKQFNLTAENGFWFGLKRRNI